MSRRRHDEPRPAKAPVAAASAAALFTLALSLLARAQVAPATQPAVPAGDVWMLTLTDAAAVDRAVVLRSLAGGQVVVANPDGTDRTVDPAAFVRLTREGTAGAGVRPTGSGLVLFLRDGQIIPGTPAPAGATASAESLHWRHPQFGVLEVPLKAVSRVARAAAALPSAACAAATDDVLSLQNGDTVRGVVTEAGPETVSLTPAQGDPVTVPWSAVRALSLADLSGGTAAAAPAGGYLIALNDGAAVLASDVRTDGATLRLTPRLKSVGAAPAVPLNAVTLLERQGDGVWSLASLPPTEVVHKPYLTVSRPPRFNSSVLGGAIEVDGREYGRGIGVTAYTRLTWTVPAGAARLRMTPGLDPSVDVGSAVVRVLVDGKQVGSDTVLKLGTKAEPLTIDLPAAARSLTIEVDFGPTGGVQARAVLADPLLLK